MTESQYIRSNNRAFIVNILINAAALGLVLYAGFRSGQLSGRFHLVKTGLRTQSGIARGDRDRE